MTTPDGCWEQAAAGDGDAFAICYLQYADRVFAHCLSRLGSRADAEDITAEVFEIAWRRRETVRVDAEAGILPWLLTTARNLISKHRRGISRNRTLMNQLPRAVNSPDHAIAVTEADACDADLALAMIVLRAMKSRDREAIELCVIHGLSPTAAAKATRVSASTMRSRLQRALIRAHRLHRSIALPSSGALAKESHA